MRLKKETSTAQRLYKLFIYVVLGLLAIMILIPVLWVMMASVKETAEHYGSPWALPSHIHWQNFVDAWTKANMGGYMLHSIFVTLLALAILLVVALPASYALARFHFTGRKFMNTCFMAGLFINIIKTLVTAKDQWTLPAGLLNLMQAQQSAAEYGPMYAGLVLVMLPVLILYICVQKNLNKGMTVGGLKG